MFKQIKSNIIYRKKRLIVELALIVALLTPTAEHIITLFIPVSEASYEKVESEVSTQALLKKYTDEEYAGMYKEAEIRAARRLFEELGVHADTLNPYKE